ncbi:MBL fold metallo-hydrolase [Desulfotalea psychrophila]|uniref:Metallo-beta-lactamase domain-containing protein n=1 Tax=Desulfotalea psychrophila (strain LSv54 / DSM 12343) TaxID=177439 RepID=Q6AJK3_DESPS|nr:MBL fold metallo-hydrolase [Desulfotalea psychrophila]CAG37477.1 conserved hypothetical protein [Desulfotalea psychrophila LSv54]
MKTLRFTIVVDNRAAEGLIAEHGYALHIETSAGNLLLDTGNKLAFVANAEALGVNLQEVSALVLSHGHYDHTGGIADILQQNKDVEIYLHAGVFQPRYSLHGEDASIVKMPLAAMQAVMHHADEKVNWLTQPVSLQDRVGLTGPIPRECSFEDTGGSFYLDPAGKVIDTIEDDNALWFHGPEGLVICLGCCHAGIINTLNYIMDYSGERKIDTVIGGLHLLHADESRLTKTAEALNGLDLKRIVACHCSGDEAVQYLADHLSCEVVAGYAGMQFNI